MAAIASLVVLIFIGRLASSGVGRLLGEDKTKGVKQVRLIKRLVRWAFNVLGLIIALHLVGLTQVATSFLAAGGVVAVVLGFAFREIGENLLAGLFLSFSRSFDVGDLIESNGIRGIVQRIEIRDVHIRTADGCDIFIPSATIYKNPLHNFTRDGLRRGSFTIGVDYGDDLQKVRETLLKTVQGHKLTLANPAPNIQIAGFTAAYVELEVFFWIDTFSNDRGLGEIRSQVMDGCHKTLAEKGFTYSSNVTTAIDMLPVSVNINQDKKTP
ncbi:MAG: mechanosensitive ion channel family protein [Gracilimonas sp.]|uniref:mechanosensitive ion channel family protein n=1 Tax=Gracilimonas TaxID=649462 RepID=UPI001B12694C|nr:mechanosensitive ion channel family protein [Gracilimonas sp.]MBO6584822.1 mechanosensitive ion channel family protein [Gracilimonas sp.]MBO6615907.1 mechanosensitive ion channel family protein [Gracilimonas sp.]